MQKLSVDQLYRHTLINPVEFEQKIVDEKLFMKRFHPRAYQSLNFGLHLKRNQNHFFITGEHGIGRIGMCKTLLREAALRKKKPKDVVLVSDFSEAYKTQYLYLEGGTGHLFKVAIEEFISQIKEQLPIIYDGHAYQLKSQHLDNNLAQGQKEALKPAYELADKLDVDIAQTENSFLISAIVNGEKIRMQNLDKLDKTLQEKFLDAFELVEEKLNKGLTKFPFLQHEYLDAGKKLNTEVANDYLTPLIKSLLVKFEDSAGINDYLKALKDAVINKLHLFWEQSAEQVTSVSQAGGENIISESSALAIFKVNLLVDHKESSKAPVIYEPNVSMPKLFGYTINSASANATDTVSLAMNHQAGLLQKASGGYLMLNVESILKDPEIWSNLKAALMSKKLTFEIPSASSVIPYHLPDFPLDVTLVMLGRKSHFYALQDIDSQFNRLFKVEVVFESELERTSEHEMVLAQQLALETENWDLLPTETSAYDRLIEFAARMAEANNRLYTNKAALRDVLSEGHAYARANNQQAVTRNTIESVLLQRQFHTGMMEDYYHQSIADKQIKIDVTGKHIGQINALTVLTIGRQSFGQPVRITAQASAGDEGVMDIEREIEMAGPIHTKGMLILSGYLRSCFMKNKSYGFSASLVMEQSYEGIDGDSASSAELLALISSLSGVALSQQLAITGSMDQFGAIQPIGGVNEKIEGFYRVCKELGLTGKQGVVIPEANVQNLMLSVEVRKAVEDGQFHIYAIAHIEQALELFMQAPAGKMDERGSYPAGSVYFKVVERLEKMSEKEAFAKV